MPLTLQAGERPVPDYELVRRLGKGGFGEVWEALGPGGIKVALKFIRLDTKGIDLEERSWKVMKDIRHPNLASLSGVWHEGGFLILAMELCDHSLKDRLDEARNQNLTGIPLKELLKNMREAAQGLNALHEEKVQHRDVKPGNLLLLKKGVKVADFGLAKVMQQTEATHTGPLSAPYAAPEFFKSKVHEHSDQFSLAVTYFHLRTGQLPFAGKNVCEVVYARLNSSPDLSLLSGAEKAVVAQALSNDPEKRWPSCVAFADALHEAVNSDQQKMTMQTPTSHTEPQPQTSARQVRWLWVLAACLLLLGTFPTIDIGSGRWLWVLAACLLLLLPVVCFFGGQLMRVVTNQGQIVLEVDDPKIEVVVKDNGVLLQDGGGQRTITVAAGAHELEVTIKDGAGETRLLTKKFTLSRGGREIVNVRQELAALTKKPERKEPDAEPKKVPESKKPDPEKKGDPIPSPEQKKPDPEPPKPEPKKLPKTLTVDLGDSVKMDFVLIDPKSKPDGGRFKMGSPAEEKGHESNEQQHDVELTKPYYLGKYVVTQEQYQQVAGDNPSYFCSGGAGADAVRGQNTNKFPVEKVSWDKADGFCADLTKKCSNQLPAELRQKGYRFALPTEAQWEYACRAGTKTRYFFGDNETQLGDHAWFEDNSGGHTHAVTEKDTSNPWGLYDMHGNVYQWCQDYYDAEYYANSPIKDPFNSKKPDPDRRVLRGGSWGDGASSCRAAYRGRNAPGDRLGFLVFRVCLPLD